MPILAMNRNEVARSRERYQLRQLVLARMPRHMHGGDRVVDDIGALPIQAIHESVDGALVARNEARREHDDVAVLDPHARMRVAGEFCKRRERFALAAAGQVAQPMTVDKLGLARLDEHRLRKWKLASLETQPHTLRHRASERNDAAAELARDFDHLSNPMQMRRKRRQEKSSTRARRELAQHRLERTFRSCASRALDVGRIREQHCDALGAKLGKTFAIEQGAVYRRVVDFEIAAVHDNARRRANRERDRVGRRMGYANRLDRERPRLERMPRLNRPQINPHVELRISQAPTRERERY